MYTREERMKAIELFIKNDKHPWMSYQWRKVTMMKRLNGSLLIICIILLLVSCGSGEKDEATSFVATVLENQSSLLVEPQKNTTEIRSSDKIVVHTNNTKIYDASGEEISISEIKVGELIKITYDGMIAESYPAQITGDKIEILE